MLARSKWFCPVAARPAGAGSVAWPPAGPSAGLVEALVSQILVVSDLVGEFGFEPGITCRLEIATGMALSIQLRAESNVEWGQV
jgi:hypothetical protein